MRKYYLIQNDNQVGPFTLEEIKNKNISIKTPVWHDGLQEWTTADNIPEIQEFLNSAPPPYRVSTSIGGNKKFILKYLIAVLLFAGLAYFCITSYTKYKNDTKLELALDLFKKTDSIDFKTFIELADQGYGKAANVVSIYYWMLKDSINYIKYANLTKDYGEDLLGEWSLLAYEYEKHNQQDKFNDWLKSNFKIITDKANSGDWIWQYKIASAYYNGWGVQVNYDSANKYLKICADNDVVKAQNKLANLYYSEKDFSKALHYFTLAANKGYGESLGALGSMYYSGKGTAADFKEAVKWWKMGVSKKDAYSEYGLGLCFAIGTEVNKDLDESQRLLKSALAHGESRASEGLKLVEQLKNGYKNNSNYNHSIESSNSSNHSSNLHMCRWCNRMFDGSGYGFNPTNGRVGDGYLGQGIFNRAFTGSTLTGDFCSIRCASEAYDNGFNQIN